MAPLVNTPIVAIASHVDLRANRATSPFRDASSRGIPRAAATQIGDSPRMFTATEAAIVTIASRPRVHAGSDSVTMLIIPMNAVSAAEISTEFGFTDPLRKMVIGVVAMNSPAIGRSRLLQVEIIISPSARNVDEIIPLTIRIAKIPVES
jgi:hypothetical protein